MIDATKIIATFDFTGAPHGLYDLEVINPTARLPTIPYRFLVERAIEPDVTIGVGGPRVILAGDVGTYSVALQSLSNLDTPYVFFQVGIPEMGLNEHRLRAALSSASTPTCAASRTSAPMWPGRRSIRRSTPPAR